MSFLTSFCDLPQKLQLSVSRFSKPSSRRVTLQGPESAPPLPISLLLLPLRRLLVGEHLVDEAVLLCLTWAHEVVAVGILLDTLDRLLRVPRQDLVEPRLQPERLLGLDL